MIKDIPSGKISSTGLSDKWFSFAQDSDFNFPVSPLFISWRSAAARRASAILRSGQLSATLPAKVSLSLNTACLC